MQYSNTYVKDIEEICKLIKNLDLINNSTFLVTGSTGLIGSTIVDFLMYLNYKKNMNITIYASSRTYEKFMNRFKVYKNNNLLKYVKYDATKNIDFDLDFDYVIYSSSIANPSDYNNYPVETMNSSYIGLNNILQYGIKHTYKKIIFISSGEVYGIGHSNKPFKENDFGYVDINKCRSCYPSSKRASETLCYAFAKEYGINFQIIRPGHVYGPTMTNTDNRISSLALKLAKNNKNIVLKSSGTQIRSFCYVLDAVSAIFTVLLNGNVNEAYNISNNNSNVTIKEYVECVASLSGVNVLYENPKNEEVALFNPMENSVLDNTKLIDLGWTPIFCLEKGIEHSLIDITQ